MPEESFDLDSVAAGGLRFIERTVGAAHDGIEVLFFRCHSATPMEMVMQGRHSGKVKRRCFDQQAYPFRKIPGRLQSRMGKGEGKFFSAHSGQDIGVSQ